VSLFSNLGAFEQLSGVLKESFRSAQLSNCQAGLVDRRALVKAQGRIYDNFIDYSAEHDAISHVIGSIGTLIIEHLVMSKTEQKHAGSDRKFRRRVNRQVIT
jgi:hypothetical protein